MARWMQRGPAMGPGGKVATLTMLTLAVVARLAHADPASSAASPPAGRTLRVCADPDNYPFTRAQGDGFENRIADVIANELGATLEYTWSAQRRGFFRTTLKARRCDVVLAVPAGFEMTRTTHPYYRSSYVFLSRADRKLRISSLDDPRLSRLKIGVQLIGDDGANTPPAHALARRGIVDNVVGYSVFAGPDDIATAVARGDIDVAIVWGPRASSFARASRPRLVVTPMRAASDDGLALAFDIAMGVRHPDAALAADLDRAITARQGDIDRILDAYRVPRMPIPVGSPR
jgi:mxaJ protein